jgi:hypothetical protein
MSINDCLKASFAISLFRFFCNILRPNPSVTLSLCHTVTYLHTFYQIINTKLVLHENIIKFVLDQLNLDKSFLIL